MQRFRNIISTVAFVLIAPAAAQAQSTSANAVPAEAPPAGFEGTQYVDSRGCGFVRATRDGIVAWIPRLDRNRQLVCGLPPTFAPSRVVENEPRVDAIVNEPVIRPAPQHRRPAAPPVASPAPTRITVTPTLPADRYRRLRVPPGYRVAWSDGRLNTNRGPQTAAGDEMMGRLWNDTVPRRLIPLEDRVQLVLTQPRPRASSRDQQAVPAARFVEAGRFADPENAARAQRRLQSLGLPMRVGQLQNGAKILLLGPFADARSLDQAQQRAIAAGFRHATLR